MGGPVPYDEFAYFADNAAEVGLAYPGPPTVRRQAVAVGPDRRVSALVWGEASPTVALVHGTGQNAHTFDTVALALHRPLVSIDLPGHGHSDGADPVAGSGVDSLATDVGAAIASLAPEAAAVVGMSLGGLTCIAMAGQSPGLVRHLVLVDITPGVTADKAAAVHAFLGGPATFDSFDDLLARTVEFNPTRSESSLRRGILHNAEEQPDGTWRWRHRRSDPPPERRPVDTEALWGVLGDLDVGVTLVRGTRDGSVVDDADEERFLATARHPRVVRVDAGHSVQGDAPLELARTIAEVVEE